LIPPITHSLVNFNTNFVKRKETLTIRILIAEAFNITFIHFFYDPFFLLITIREMRSHHL